MQHRPRGLVGADLEQALQAQRRDPVLLGGEQPAGVNQTVSGVRVRSKIVPAVGEVRAAQAAHSKRPSASFQPPACPQPGQTNPSGQRSHSR